MNSNWVNVYFRPGKDDDLMAWVKENGRANFGYFGRLAFEALRAAQTNELPEAARCYRLCKQLFGDNWEAELKHLEELAKAM